MNYLLDTHTLIWALTDTKKLPAKAKMALEDVESISHVSSVTFWEMAIKIRNGRLEPIGDWNSVIPYVEKLGFHTIPLSPEEAATSKNLTEDTHFDPFDRMLIWQAIQRDLVLVSKDPEFEKFKADGLRLLWK